MVEIRDKIERRPIGSLIPYARNARTHSDAQIHKIGKYMIGMSVPPRMTEQVARAVCEQWLGVQYETKTRTPGL